jgi:hypothetical protein
MQIRDCIREMLGAGIAGRTAAALLLVACVLALIAVVEAARARSGRRLRALVLANLVALTLGLSASAWVIREARRQMVTVALSYWVPISDSFPWILSHRKEGFAWLIAMAQSEAALLLAGSALAWSAALLAGAALVQAAHPRGLMHGAPLRAVLLVIPPVIATALGVGLARRGVAVFTEMDAQEISYVNRLDEVLRSMPRPLETARVHVVLLALAGCAYAALFAGRRGPPGERRFGRVETIASLTLFAAGLASFILTRPLAYDALHPIPSSEREHLGCWTRRVDHRTLPLATRCGSAMDGPLLEIAPDGASIDGVHATTLEYLGLILRDKRKLWIEVARRPASELPAVLVAAEANARIADIVPYLSVLKESFGSTIVALIAEPPKAFPTRTLGEVPGSPRCCSVLLTIDPLDIKLPVDATWGDLARAAQEPK